MATIYPINVDVKVHITDGENSGAATYGFPLGKLPTTEDMTEIFKAVMGSLPDGFRLMTRHESLIYYMREEKGYRGPNNVAMPKLKDGDEWHDPSTANIYMESDEHLFDEEEF